VKFIIFATIFPLVTLTYLQKVNATELETNVNSNSPPLPTINQNGNFQNSPTQIFGGSQYGSNCGIQFYTQLGSNFQNTSIQAGLSISSNKCEKQSETEKIRQNGETTRECIQARVQLEIAGKNPDIACLRPG
jgi:hypothetical protein